MTWDYLGYITLSDNQSTGFKSRELKSANVPACISSFVKLKLGKNHINSYNINNQVSIRYNYFQKSKTFNCLQISVIAINILGTVVENRKASNESNSIDDKVQNLLSDPDYISPYDDLAFEMYVDNDVAKIIREMEYKKHVAVISK